MKNASLRAYYFFNAAKNFLYHYYDLTFSVGGRREILNLPKLCQSFCYYFKYVNTFFHQKSQIFHRKLLDPPYTLPLRRDENNMRFLKERVVKFNLQTK